MQIANRGTGRQARMEAGQLAAVLGVKSCGVRPGGALDAADGEVRYELVARLRAEIAAGTYRVESADVAEKMMAAGVR